MKLVKDTDKSLINKDQITDQQAEEAFKTILQWIGEDPNREGLLETPKRVVKAFKEYFKGYKEDPIQVLDKTFGDVDGYDDMVIQKNISVQSHCEHQTQSQKRQLSDRQDVTGRDASLRALLHRQPERDYRAHSVE